ncbi:hypothetical protein E1301_Tti003415 [Triplophysa tibetana]|uniref:Uncharacterized protein n=1 Tax=Triplophysa tibetana TaxID=1572043 RepID=A0A5A9PMT5_9TELE|nr:hypothetical protein E1301_Tti003415 [Triplophysa tibetana]
MTHRGSHDNTPRNGNDKEPRDQHSRSWNNRTETTDMLYGWTKVTSKKSLKIHLGMKKCLRELSEGPHIDQFFTRGTAAGLLPVYDCLEGGESNTSDELDT